MSQFAVSKQSVARMSKSTLGSKANEDYERCFFDLLNRNRWKSYANLSSVLDDQLVYKGKVTRPTQTNWKWKKMAQRWRHANIIEPKEIVLRASDSEGIDLDVMRKMKKSLDNLRKVRSNDKIVDTSDLEYDPYNINTEYNMKRSSVSVKYIPPIMKETIKSYARKWKLYAAEGSLSAKRRYRRVFPEPMMAINRRVFRDNSIPITRVFPDNSMSTDRRVSPEKTMAIDRRVFPDNSMSTDRRVFPEKTMTIDRRVFPDNSMSTDRRVFPQKTTAIDRRVFPGNSMSNDRRVFPDKTLAINRRVSRDNSMSTDRRVFPEKAVANDDDRQGKEWYELPKVHARRPSGKNRYNLMD